MNERVEALANQFDQASNDFLTMATALSDSQWTLPFSNDDPRPAGVVAHHVASGYEATINALHGVLGGADLGLTWEMIHAGNAAHAAAHQAPDREETLALLRSNGAMAAATLRGLSDEQLDQPVLFSILGDGPIPAQAVIEGLVIGHIGMHAGDFRA